ncbi:MAG: repeat protein [Paenibacillus sp.]|jgi:sugar lactone lactonase YvrE|nr:repeat protein [Paenibacillus sp.]
MKRTGKLLVISVLAASFMGGTTVFGANLSKDGIKGSEDQLLTDVTTYAGSGDFGSLNADRLSSTFRNPSSLLILQDGSMLVTDTRNHVVRKISGASVVNYAGVILKKDEKGFPVGGLLDGKPDFSIFQEPSGIAADAAGNVYIADAANNAIRKIDSAGQVMTVAGNGIIGSSDSNGAAASFNHPQDIAVKPDGTVFVADTLNHVIRSISPAGQVSTLTAPSTRTVEVTPGQAVAAGDLADGEIKSAKFNEPSGLAIDNKGNLYVSDSGNQRIRYIDFEQNQVTTVAGSSRAADGNGIYEKSALYAAGDFADGEASKALFDFPRGLALTEEGGLVIADSLNHSIRYLIDGKVTTLAGKGFQKPGETDGPDRSALFQKPTDVAVSPEGTLFVTDAFNNKIRRIDPFKLPSNLPQDETVKVVAGSQLISFEVRPEIVNGRTMVPVRAITEALGYKVGYEESNRSVQLTKDDITIELYVDKTGIKKMEKNMPAVNKETDAAPYIKDDTTYVPIRFFAEEIGLDVQWYDPAKTAILRQKSTIAP